MEDEELLLLTTEDLVAMLKVKKSWIYAEVEANRIPALRLGRQLRFRRKDIAEWLNTSRVGPDT